MRKSNRKAQVSYQTAENKVEAVATNPDAPATPAGKSSTWVEDFEFGEIHKGTFTIEVKGAKKNDPPAYSNENEPFTFRRVGPGLSNLLRHLGAKLEPSQIELLDSMFSGSNEKDKDNSIGKAILALTNVVRSSDKANDKQARYNAVAAEHKKLTDAEIDVERAKGIRIWMKVTGTSAESVIEGLKSQGSLPEDYTVRDFLETKTRKTRGSSDDESDE